MELMNRLNQWAQLQRIRPVAESPDVMGGRDGELMLKHLVASAFQFNDASLLSGRRIPSKRQHRRREIDLIVCTHQKIHLIEIKNWSGVLDVRKGVWLQTRRNGEVIEHPDLLRENLLRRDAVVEYLQDRGLALADSFIRAHIIPQVVFMNPRLAISPEVEALQEVISRRELDSYLGNKNNGNLTERIFASLIDLCLVRDSKNPRSASNSIPADQYRQIVTFLAQTQTWDQLHFHGTKVLTGDVVALELGSKIYRKPELNDLAAHLPVKLSWTRSPVWGLLKSVTGLSPLGTLSLANSILPISPSDTVTFHEVGNADPAPHQLAHLDSILLG